MGFSNSSNYPQLINRLAGLQLTISPYDGNLNMVVRGGPRTIPGEMGLLTQLRRLLTHCGARAAAVALGLVLGWDAGALAAALLDGDAPVLAAAHD
jgi:hypothetical protein